MPGVEEDPPSRFDRPLRVAALVKQIPVGEHLSLGEDRRLVRTGPELEMNAYCRRAVSKGVEMAKASGGSCTVFTLGPPTADDVLREAVAWGADGGVHLCDPAFAGSDSLATARALTAALEREGPFDLVLVGRNSLDGDTGQVGPEIAQLSDLPFLCGVRAMRLDGALLSVTLEYDDGSAEAEVQVPAVLSVAERLCEPCKVPPDERALVAPEMIRTFSAADLGPGPWGQDGSPTLVGETRHLERSRAGKVLSGPIQDQVSEAVAILVGRGALTGGTAQVALAGGTGAAHVERSGRSREILVLVEPQRAQVAAELLGAAAGLADQVGARVHAFALGDDDPDALGANGADAVTSVLSPDVAVLETEDVAGALVRWCTDHDVWAVLGPSTSWGREVLGRSAAALGAGLVGDAIALRVEEGELVASKPAFSGALVADITCTSSVRLVSIRPGVLLTPDPSPFEPVRHSLQVLPRGRVRTLSNRRDDDVEVLARADVVIGVGAAVQPGDYHELSPLAAVLGAELAATRKVTDKGWAPRARQVGITGRSISPRLYVAVGVQGKFNHLVGVRAAATILAVNVDPDAVIFGHADVGIVGDWHEVVPALTREIRVAEEGTRG